MLNQSARARVLAHKLPAAHNLEWKTERRSSDSVRELLVPTTRRSTLPSALRRLQGFRGDMSQPGRLLSFGGWPRYLARCN